MPNVYRPDFDDDRRARLGAQAGAEKLRASLYELGPGSPSVPFGADDGAEELLVVLGGTPTLGERELAEGEVVSGLEGAQEVGNRSDAAARVLIVSSRREA